MSESKQTLQKQIRQSFEAAYKQRLLTMKNFYEMRYQTLQQTIGSSYKKVLQDQILTTMVRDTTTVTFLQQRVKQLFKQIVENQREVLIQKLGLQYSELKFHYQEMEKKFTNYRKQTENNQQKSFKDRINSETEISQYSQGLRKKEQQIFETKLQLKQKSSQIKQKQRLCEGLQNKMNELKEENIFLKLKLQKFEDEINEAIGVHKTKFQLKDVDLQESQKKLTLLQNTMKQMEKVSEQKIQQLERKYRKKIGQYKNKIEQYKAKILEIINQRPNSDANPGYQVKIQQLEKKLLFVSRQSERKMNEVKIEKDKVKADMQKKYEGKYKELQSYYEKLLEEKVEQSQKIAEEAAQKIKSEQSQIRKYIQYIQQNSAPIDEYNKLSKYCEQLKEHLQNKILQNQKQVNTLGSNNKQLAAYAQIAQRTEAEMRNKINELELSFNDAKNKLKAYEQQIGAVRTNQKKMKGLLADLQSNLLSKQQQNLHLRNEIQKVRSQNTQYLGTINERQNLFQQKSQQVELLQKRLSKLNGEIQSLYEQIEKNQIALNHSKKSLSQKQNIISTMSQDGQFKIENLNSQIQKHMLTLENYTQKMKQITTKCNYLQTQITQSIKLKNQLETNYRKIELQNKYLKESEQSFRQQHEAYVQDYKKKLDEKNANIQDLQNSISELKKNHKQQNQINEAKCRKLTQAIKKINRIYSTQLDNITRSLKDIKVYVESVQKLLKSEVKIIYSNTTLKIKEQLFNIIGEKNQQLRKIKQNLQYEKNQHIDASKTKSQKIEMSYKQKLESQIKNFEALIGAKDKEIDRLQKERKKNLNQKDELYQSNRNLDKRVKDLQLIIQNQKVQSKSKITEIIRNFDSQKDKIINDYAMKRDKQEEEIDQISKNMKNIRRQLENSKIQYEELKNKWASEQNTAINKQKMLQKQLQRKKIEVQNLNQQIKSLRDHCTKIDTQIKSYIEKNIAASHNLAEFQFKNHQISGQLAIAKTKIERLGEENQEMKRELLQRQNERQTLEMSKKRMQNQLKQIKLTINKSNKSQQIRALQQLDIETKQLSSKVSQLRKVNLLMSNDRTPLRS